MTESAAHLLAMHRAMLEALGPSGWWPAESAFEVLVGAVLTQNTNWKNVEKAIAVLKARELLSGPALLALPEEELAACIQPAGYYRLKAARLRNLLLWLETRCRFDLSRLSLEAAANLDALRHDLLTVKGVGPETADSILLYALQQPSMVVDAYTARIFQRHGLVPEDVTYHELREYCMDRLPQDVSLYNEFHALLVRVGHACCKKRAPLCASCPLEALR
ncbi:endonuclease III domain-containing protein [Megalodesulfovibrio paquesii]